MPEVQILDKVTLEDIKTSDPTEHPFSNLYSIIEIGNIEGKPMETILGSGLLQPGSNLVSGSTMFNVHTAHHS